MSAAVVDPVAGRHDAAARRKAQRRGRERGCWVYISGEQLGKAGLASDAFVPWYRIWGRGMTAMWICWCGARNRLRDTQCRHCGGHKP